MRSVMTVAMSTLEASSTPCWTRRLAGGGAGAGPPAAGGGAREVGGRRRGGLPAGGGRREEVVALRLQGLRGADGHQAQAAEHGAGRARDHAVAVDADLVVADARGDGDAGERAGAGEQAAGVGAVQRAVAGEQLLARGVAHRQVAGALEADVERAPGLLQRALLLAAPDLDGGGAGARGDA